jgi:hypothetical protein
MGYNQVLIAVDAQGVLSDTCLRLNVKAALYVKFSMGIKDVEKI